MIAGLQELRSWMRAELFLTNFRPVPLTEHAVFKGCVYAKVRRGHAFSCFGDSKEKVSFVNSFSSYLKISNSSDSSPVQCRAISCLAAVG